MSRPLFALLTGILFACSSPVPPEKPEDGFESPRTVQPATNYGYLTADQSLKTFRLPKGYHLELVADESMLNEPVAITWDGNARMFVCQMETYMQTVDTAGEHMHESRILLLEDTDNDGKMDKRSEFVKGLMLPRMILCVGNELLVNETDTYDIISYKDTDGDGVADERKVVFHTDKKPFGNLEHQRSGLDWNLDNFIYVTVDPVRYKWRNGRLMLDSLHSGSTGQWGLTHDDYGRLYFSRAGAENAGNGFHINPAYGSLEFADAYVDSIFGAVWPILASADVQGGLKRLRDDTTLNHFTAANGQVIVRGDRLPRTLRGDYLINEPVARIIRRAKIIQREGKRTLVNAYDKEEFISSYDVNFRPVNLYNGPDGCLYIVDMNRGIIQEGQWTGEGSYLRKQILRLGLQKNVQRGRIFRLVYDGMPRGPKPNMLNQPSRELLPYLDHPNGWWRDNAQKELVARADSTVINDLREIACGRKGPLNKKPSALGQVHALWTLDGLHAMDKEVLDDALDSDDPQVRKTAIWIAESFVKMEDKEMIAELAGLKDDHDYDVLIQLVLTLSQSKSDPARQTVDFILKNHSGNEMMDGVVKSMKRNAELKQYGFRRGGMDETSRQRLVQGGIIFRSLCATCHGTDGKGVPTGLAPPLTANERLRRNKNGMIRILLNGLTGPVDGKNYREQMIGMGMNDDEWIASVLSYVRYDLGLTDRNFYWPPSKEFVANILVTPEEVAKIRKETAARQKPWMWDELTRLEKK